MIGGSLGTWTASRRRFASLGLSALVFGCAVASLFGPMAGADLREVVFVNRPPELAEGPGWGTLRESDLQFVVAVTARNASTLAQQPRRFFDLEQCHPVDDALAFGEMLLTPGLLGLPAWLLFRDPLVTFNFVIVTLPLIAAFAMAWLVRQWTGLASAGLVAGLLYAFHPIRIGDTVHFYVWDMAWTVLALGLARRLFLKRSWRVAACLAAVVVLQMGGSPYPLLAAGTLAVFEVAWLLRVHGLRSLPVAPVVSVLVIGLVTAAVLFHPQLALQGSGSLPERARLFFLPYASLLPGQPLSLGLVLPAFAVVGIVLGGRGRSGKLPGDPRWAVLVGGLVCLILAAGGNTGDVQRAVIQGEPPPPLLPNLWSALSAALPPLRGLRGPAALLVGFHLSLAILAGLGGAALLRMAPDRWRPGVAGLLVLVAYVAVVQPARLGLEPRVRHQAVALRPSEETLAFFADLEAEGDQGPILEVPSPGGRLAEKRFASGALLRAAYHRRPVGSCGNSYRAPESEEVRELGRRLPNAAALARLRELGFTTIVVHHPPGTPGAAALRAGLDALAEQSPALEPLLRTPARTAYRIVRG